MQVIHTEEKRKANYFTMLNNTLYFNVWPEQHRTYSVKDGIEKCIIKNSCATHNFRPFKLYDSEYAIGGMDAWKFEKSWKEIDDYKEFKVKFKERFGTEYIRDEARFEMFKERIRNKKHLNHSDGLYLFKNTENGWTQVFKKPIITVANEGFQSALDYGKSSEFDGQPSIFVYAGKVFIYLRWNVKFKTRFYQYSYSKNLIDWAPFKQIQIKDYDYDLENYYMPNFFEYRNFIIGYVPYFKDDKACIRVLKSKDGEHFEIVNELFESNIVLLTKNAPKNPIVPVHGQEKEKYTIIQYYHCNYLGIEKKPVEIKKRIISENDFIRECGIC